MLNPLSPLPLPPPRGFIRVRYARYDGKCDDVVGPFLFPPIPSGRSRRPRSLFALLSLDASLNFFLPPSILSEAWPIPTRYILHLCLRPTQSSDTS